jgi:ParB family transcriptional regulator, chromosome partitioning protein
VKDCIVSGAGSVTGSMATKLKQYSGEGNLTELAVQLILNEKKTETGKVTLTEKKIRKYFPKEYNREQIEQVIYELLDNWKKSQ